MPLIVSNRSQRGLGEDIPSVVLDEIGPRPAGGGTERVPRHSGQERGVLVAKERQVGRGSGRHPHPEGHREVLAGGEVQVTIGVGDGDVIVTAAAGIAADMHRLAADLARHETGRVDGRAVVAQAGGVGVVAIELEVQHQVVGEVGEGWLGHDCQSGRRAHQAAGGVGDRQSVLGRVAVIDVVQGQAQVGRAGDVDAVLLPLKGQLRAALDAGG